MPGAASRHSCKCAQLHGAGGWEDEGIVIPTAASYRWRNSCTVARPSRLYQSVARIEHATLAMKRPLRSFCTLAALSLAVAACGGGSSGTAVSDATAGQPPTPAS